LRGTRRLKARAIHKFEGDREDYGEEACRGLNFSSINYNVVIKERWSALVHGKTM
jgi:hypothetical protein